MTENLENELTIYRVYEQDIAETYGVGTWYKGVKINALYDELVDVLGEPTYPTPNEDQTVFRSWVIRWNMETYEIYDYNTFDEEYTLNYLTSWHVGASEGADVLEFSKLIEDAIKNYYEKNGKNKRTLRR